MISYGTIRELLTQLTPAAELRNGSLLLNDETAFRESVLDRLVYSAVFGDNDVRTASRWIIWQAAQELGALPASIHDYYIAGGRDAWRDQTTPAINVRGIVYDTAQAIFRAARTNNAKQVIFEIARSEMGYTAQRPEEYATVVLAAAMRQGYRGPVFIQGDHFQINAKKYAGDPEGEVQGVKDLIREALTAGFYNIDIDSSTIVDLSQPTVPEQQRLNYERCAELTAYIRELEPQGVTVSVGGEIGEVGGKNSTVEDLDAFMLGYDHVLSAMDGNPVGISKISVQTGTSHGGVVLPDGSIADVKVDFDTLGELSRAARERYHLGGAVQHGASTLPEQAFDRFSEANACEVHLATGFQNIIYDSPSFPAELRDEIYAYLTEHHADERKSGMTDAQFYYTTRKRGFGPFKQRMWDMPEETRARISAELEERFNLIFQRLNVGNTADLVDEIVKPVALSKPRPAVLEGAEVS
ncbi:MAG TPA: class II fructose-bisphosphate aldolase [Nitrolancea sp.]|nr:class II fructose-bisphosphate aldolase [Nitrolancea sp.]